MIKFSHTIFALPFAIAALLVIAYRHAVEVNLTILKTILIVIAFTCMRSFAMAFNRLVDSAIDAKNPRTAMREIPAGTLTRRAVWIFAVISLIGVVTSAWLLAPLAGYLALPAALLVASYSLTKRFTWFCHFWLGAVIGMAPTAVYIALLQTIYPEAVIMSLTLTFYIAGFDILYALQDIDFDRTNNLFSVPVRFGAAGAMWISRLSHTTALICAALLVHNLALGSLSWFFWCVLAGLLFTEHYLIGSVKNPRYEKIPVAFFNANSAFSITFLLTILAGLLL